MFAFRPSPLVVSLVLVLSGMFLSACRPAVLAAAPTLTAESSASPARFPIPTEMPVHTSVSTATASPTPTVSIPPTDLPPPDDGLPAVAPPVIPNGPVLSPENAGRMVELGAWGDGYAFDLATIRSSQVVSGSEMLVAYEKLPDIPDYPDAIRTRFWELPCGKLRLDMLHPMGYDNLFVSPDGTYYATHQGGCPSETPKFCSLAVWYVPPDERVLYLEPNFLETAVFSPDNHWIALASGQEIKIWDLAAGELVHFLPQSFQFDRFLFSNDSKLLAGYQRMTENVQIWKVETGELLATLASGVYAGAFYPSAIAFSPDDAYLAIGFNGIVSLWRVSDWSEGPAWMWHESINTKIAFSPDGRLLASGAEDGSLVIAEVSNGEVLANLAGHSSNINNLAFSKDGKLLISTALDGTLRFWGIAEE